MRAGQKIEGLLGGWKPQNPPKLIEVIIAKLLSLLETIPFAASTPAASTNLMKIQAIVHKAEEGGFWAEVPSLPGCATQGETMAELMDNLRDAIEGCLSVAIDQPQAQPDDQVIELAL